MHYQNYIASGVVVALALSWSVPTQSAEPIVKTTQKIVPILNDGTDAVVLDFSIEVPSTTALRTIMLSFKGTSDLTDILSLAAEVTSEGAKKPVRSVDAIPVGKTSAVQSVAFAPPLSLAPGTHKGRVMVRIRPGADLTHRIACSLKSVQLSGDRDLMGDRDYSNRPLRLAHCIHQRGQFDCHTFRIPGIARTKNGTLLAVYDMRYNSRKDLQEHIDIGLSRSVDGGQTWADPVPIMDMGTYGGKSQKENGVSDPNILVDEKTGEVFVSAVWTHGKPGTHQWVGRGSEPGHSIDRSSQFMFVRSRDDGESWSPPENWTTRLKQASWWLFAPGPGNGITLKDGTLVMPSQGRDDHGDPFSNIMYSRDHGKSWTVSAAARRNTSESAVVELSDGRLLLNMRDNRNRGNTGDTNGRAVAVTDDLGKTWTPHSTDNRSLPEPVCMASTISHDLPENRRVLLFSNPHNKRARRDMTIQISFDNGETWPRQHHVLLDELGGAYSSLVMVDADTVGILYESSAADMVFQKIPLKELLH